MTKLLPLVACLLAAIALAGAPLVEAAAKGKPGVDLGLAAKGKPPAHKGGGGGGKPSFGSKVGLDDVLAAGLTAAAVVALLEGDSRPLSIGAKPLPPGVAKNLARGKPLPPGIAKQSVPGALLGRLPMVDGHEWTRIGLDLVLIAAGTLIVKEVVKGVFD